MTLNHLPIALLVAAALAGCNQEDHTINGDAMADGSSPAVAPIDPASMPAAIAATKSYRCKDNSVVTIDWLADNVTANIRPTETATPVQLKTAEAGTPFTADGYSLTGTVDSTSVTVTLPGKGSQSCDV